jgi:hypothetical protein
MSRDIVTRYCAQGPHLFGELGRVMLYIRHDKEEEEEEAQKQGKWAARDITLAKMNR